MERTTEPQHYTIRPRTTCCACAKRSLEISVTAWICQCSEYLTIRVFDITIFAAPQKLSENYNGRSWASATLRAACSTRRRYSSRTGIQHSTRKRARRAQRCERGAN
eukprot:3551280-Pleurochrysis_carterae.AAC.2